MSPCPRVPTIWGSTANPPPSGQRQTTINHSGHVPGTSPTSTGGRPLAAPPFVGTLALASITHKSRSKFECGFGLIPETLKRDAEALRSGETSGFFDPVLPRDGQSKDCHIAGEDQPMAERQVLAVD